MALITTLINKIIGWVDTLLALFIGTYSKDYSKWIVYIVVGLVAAKMFKFKINLGK